MGEGRHTEMLCQNENAEEIRDILCIVCCTFLYRAREGAGTFQVY